jgi:hypothetical protein
MTTRRRLIPNDIDGWFGIVGLDEKKKLQRTRHPWGVYGLLSRHARPGSKVFLLHSQPARNLNVVHGTALVAPSGERTILLVSDERAQRARLELLLPEPLRAKRLSRVTTDRVRLRQPLPAIEPADPSKLPVVVNPMSLTVLTAPA